MTSVSYGCTSGLSGVEGTSVANRRVRSAVAGRGRAAAALGAPALGGIAYSDALKAARRSIRAVSRVYHELENANVSFPPPPHSTAQSPRWAGRRGRSSADIDAAMCRIPPHATPESVGTPRVQSLQKFRLDSPSAVGQRGTPRRDGTELLHQASAGCLAGERGVEPGELSLHSHCSRVARALGDKKLTSSCICRTMLRICCDHDRDWLDSCSCARSSLPSSLASLPHDTMAVRFFATSSHLRVQKRNIVWRSTVTFMEDKPLPLLPSRLPFQPRLHSSRLAPSTVVRGRRLPRLWAGWSASWIAWRGRSEVGRHSRRRLGQASSPAGKALQGRSQS